MKEECKRYFERVSEYLDGELDPELCLEIEAHLEECPPCRACFESLKKTVDLCRNAPHRGMPDDVKVRLKKRLYECMSGAGERAV